MMSASTRRFSLKVYTSCQICILLVCLQQIRSENVSMSKEGLREEHLLLVRMTRSASETGFEGSGDEEPIQVLQSGIMERMTLKADEALEEGNRVLESSETVDEVKSKESIESTDEGSGFGDEESKSDLVAEKEAVNNTASDSEESEEVEVSTMKDKLITTVVPKVNVTEVSLETTTVKEEESTETATEAATERSEATTPPPLETVTPGEETLPPVTVTEIKMAETETTKLETTTFPSTTIEMLIIGRGGEIAATETEPEVIEAKKIEPVLAELSTKAPEEVKTDVAITVITETTSIENETLLENVNLTSGMGTLLMKSDSRFLDTNEKVLESSKDPSRLGTYIVISLILLSFLSLIGFIMMRRRVQKRRKKSNIDPETLDTEKALLSLSEYKDHPDGVDEGKIKNNEITPIVIKSNSQINKFEKNTNFSSPKNLNTKANEKNVEKENVLRKTSDNLTQVIIEDATKDVDEEKAQTNAEKLIVRTHLDQDSIPKKPVIVNRTSLGCVPVSQD